MPNIKSYGDPTVSDSRNTRVAPFLGSGATALSVTVGAYGRLHLGHKHGRSISQAGVFLSRLADAEFVPPPRTRAVEHFHCCLVRRGDLHHSRHRRNVASPIDRLYSVVIRGAGRYGVIRERSGRWAEGAELCQVGRRASPVDAVSC